jgi:integrase
MPTGKKPKFCYSRDNSPFWQYEFVIERERYRGSTGCEEAKAAAAFVEEQRVKIREEIARNLANRPHIRGGKRQITLADALDLFEQQRASKTKTLRDQQRYAEYLLNLAGGGKTFVSEISVEDFMNYRSRRAKMATPKGTLVKGSTINREISHARNVWNHIAFLKYDVGDPIKWGLLLASEDENHRHRELSGDEEARLFKALDRIFPDVVPLVRFCLLTAVRKSAAVNLLWKDVDFGARQCTIVLKSKKRERRHIIPLTEKLVQLLEAQPRGLPEVFTFEAKKTKTYANGNLREKGQRYRFTVDGIMDRWYKALTEAGVEDFRFHDLRHTGASRIVRHSRSLPAAQKLLGHSVITTTMRYAQVLQEDVLRAMEEVDAAHAPRPASKKRPHTEAPHLRAAG